jgi:hypothetical protein
MSKRSLKKVKHNEELTVSTSTPQTTKGGLADFGFLTIDRTKLVSQGNMKKVEFTE